jgi:biotin carboxyl carrier protein
VSHWLVRLLLAGGVVVLGAGAALLWERRKAAPERDADAPIEPPSRVRASAGAVVVEISPDDAPRLGIRLAALAPVRAAPSTRIPGELVADPERTTSIRAPLGGRLSVPEGGRWPQYGERVPEGATLARVSDAIPLEAPRSGVVTQVGAQPGEMVAPGQLLLTLVDYGRPVARIGWNGPAPTPPRRIELEVSGPAGRSALVPAELIGPAPEADPLTRLPAFLYRAREQWAGARPGLAVIAVVPVGPQASGMLVPDRAVVQWEGLVWAYVQREPGQFVRRRVPTDRPADGGFVVGSTWTARDSVVVSGAEQLLSEEFRARVTVGDEQGE